MHGFISRPLIVASAAALISIGIVITVVLRTKSAGDRVAESPDVKSVRAPADPASNMAQFDAYLKKVQDKKGAEQIFKDVVLPDRHEFDQEAVALAEKEFAANSHRLQAAPGSSTMAEAEAREREWWRQLFGESFRKFGSQNPKWDKQAATFLTTSADAFAKPELDGTTAAEVAEQGISLVQAGCDDPLVKFVCGVLVSRYDRQDNRNLIPQAFERFPSSHYPLDVVLRITLPMATRQNWSNLIYAYRQKSQELGKDGLLGADAATARGALFKMCRQTVPWIFYNEVRDFLIAVYGTPHFDPWLRAVLTARYFDELSRGYIDLETVQPRIKKGTRRRRSFVEVAELRYRHKWTAQTYYLDAWKIDPSLPEAPLGLLQTARWRWFYLKEYGGMLPGHEIDASGLTGKTVREASRFWFDQVVRVRFDHLTAYDEMRWINQWVPSPDGPVSEQIAFGRECLATARFDTQVPNVLFEVLRYLEKRAGDQNVYRLPGVYEDCQKIVSGYSAVAKTVAEKNALKSRLACCAIAGARNDEAKRLVAELGDTADAVVFDEQNVNLHDARKLLFEKHPNHGLFPELDAVFGVAFGADDDTLLTADGNSRSTTRWNLKDRAAHGSFLHEDDVAAFVAASPDGKTIATTGTKGTVWLWSAETGNMLRSLAHETQVRILCFSARGNLLATSTGEGEGKGGMVRVWDVETGKELARRTSAVARFHSLAFHPDGKTLVLAGGSFISWTNTAPGEVVLWEFEADRVGKSLQLFERSTYGVAVSPDGRQLAAVGQGHEFDQTRVERYPAEIALVDLPDSMNVRRWKLPPGVITGLTFLGNGDTLATSGPDLAIRVWNSADARLIAEFSGHRFTINSLAPSPQGSRLVSRDSAGAIRIWGTSGTATSSQVQSELLDVPFPEPVRIYADPNGRFVATCNRRFGVTFWDRDRNWNSSAVFPVHDDLQANDFDISPDGKTLVLVGGTVPGPTSNPTGTGRGVIQLWDIRSRKLLKRLEANLRTVSCARFSPDGRMLATGSDDQRVIVWNPATGKPFDWGELKEQTGPVADLQFSPDSTLLATGDRQYNAPAKGTVRIWKMPADPQADGIRVVSQKTLAEFNALGELTVRFSPDGKSLLAFDPLKGCLYDTTSWKKTLDLKGAKGAFSFDGKRLITTGDTLIRDWQLGVNQSPQESKVSSAGIWTALEPTPDGRYFLAANRKSGRVVLWDTTSHALAETMPKSIK